MSWQRQTVGFARSRLPGQVTVHPFEQRVAQVVQADGSQSFVCHLRPYRRLHHYGRQLFVVTYHHELADSLFARWRAPAEQTQQLGLQNLCGFVNDGRIETLQGKQLTLAGEGGHRSYKDGAAFHPFDDCPSVATGCQHILYQIGPVRLFTSQLAADADEVYVRFDGAERFAYLVHCPVGIREQQQLLPLPVQPFHDAAQGTRRLSGTGRAYQQEAVLCCLRFEGDALKVVGRLPDAVV